MVKGLMNRVKGTRKSPSGEVLPSPEHLEFVDDGAAAVLLTTPTRARILLWCCFLFFMSAIVWASWAELDEVTVGQGKVIPSRQLQVVQNLEGGIVKEIFVKEGDIVEKGQPLLRIDDTRFRSDFREREKELVTLKGDVARLRAEMASVEVKNDPALGWRDQVTVTEVPIQFPEGYEKVFVEYANRERSVQKARLNNLKNQLYILGQQIEQKEQELIELNAKIRTVNRSVDLARQELNISRPLAKEGIVPQVELIKLERQVNDMQGELESNRLLIPKLNSVLRETIFKRNDIALKFRADSQTELNEKQGQLGQLSEGQVGLRDRVDRTSVIAPLKGTIKKLKINTLGGVVQPGMDLMEIVPLEDTLLVEAKISPKDIAFLRPGLDAVVKITAYDFTIYGGLHGKVEQISADSIQDEEGNSFYLVRVRTEKSYLGDELNALPIIPGMLASADIITGKKSVLDYLLKPILRAKQSALRER
ncbi:HlyD family type I secretion periplasmic adaptor subunit [Aeromonas enteropelogenes]|uniref:HlyD family type I secretion periplasmic adaptor subunit n=1 Tax=Aeromonas TaxID=642 RepID=UPI001CBD4719|nr:HlyD family type I secretion periplasmic adaptor subunit [Aeromonas enteropelogenes]UAK73816.1 HlyD family type I secretion periplasmic adaptor subunit [Aeromonas enteropelogenes]